MEKRLHLLLKEYSLTSVRFADVLDIQPSAVSHLLSGRNKPGFDLLSRILTRFPEINPRWLILGEEPMYYGSNDEKQSETGSRPPTEILKQDQSPSIEAKEAAHIPSLFSEDKNHPASGDVVGTFAEAMPEISTPFPGLHDNAAIKTVIIFYTDGTFESFGRK